MATPYDGVAQECSGRLRRARGAQEGSGGLGTAREASKMTKMQKRKYNIEKLRLYLRMGLNFHECYFGDLQGHFLPIRHFSFRNFSPITKA